MTTNHNKQQAPPQAGPVAQQLAQIQANGQQAKFNGQQPSTGHPQKRTPNWTGFSSKTLWDWLPLFIQLLGALAIPVAIALGTSWFSYQQNQTNLQISERQHQADLQIAADQQRETTLTTYLDNMSDLLLNHSLRKAKPGDEVSQVARERTLTTLRRLEANRNRIVVQFLQDTHLISGKNAVVDLSFADLSKDDLKSVDLSGVDLSGVNLSGADLSGAILSGAFLNYAQLNKADLSGADLNKADLSGAFLSYAHLFNADLRRATLSGALLNNANLSGAFLNNANLSGAFLNNANLSGVDLTDATLTDAFLRGADLRGADLRGADLRDATMPDGSKHP